jgi:hypothetical protein
MHSESASLHGELWGVTSLFNGASSPVLLENLRQFSEAARSQELKLAVIELAVGSCPFVVRDRIADLVLRFRCADVMWQKERLLNIGISQLSPLCDKVVWLDGDILFENAHWVKETSALLDSYPVVQPFSRAFWLAQGCNRPPFETTPGLGGRRVAWGMARTLALRSDRRRLLGDYFIHGHCGFAWAARRELLAAHGLYDRRILGGGDVVIAHSIYGDREFWSGRNKFCLRMTPAELQSIAEWGRRVYDGVRGAVSFTEGSVFHLWHGDLEKRGYLQRQEILWGGRFDPYTDISLGADGCWQWSSDKPALHRQVRDYFEGRAAASGC